MVLEEVLVGRLALQEVQDSAGIERTVETRDEQGVESLEERMQSRVLLHEHLCGVPALARLGRINREELAFLVVGMTHDRGPMTPEELQRTRCVAFEQRLLMLQEQLVEVPVHTEQVEEAAHTDLREWTWPIPHSAVTPPSAPTAIIGQYASAPWLAYSGVMNEITSACAAMFMAP